MKTSILIESIDLTEAQFDADNRVLRNVTLIRAGMSANRRFYPDRVLQTSAPIFEGSKAFDSHKRGERQLSELTGWYANVRYENNALKADRYFSKTDAGRNVMSVVEDILAGTAPKTLAGLSINAVGTGKQQKFDDGEALAVESITAANSVDDVFAPAAGGTYLAASGGDELTKELLNAITFEEWFEARPEFMQRVQKEMKTVRQDDALKAAKAEAETATQALNEAQAKLTQAEAARDAAILERDSKARELALEKTFRKVGLPLASENDLRERLMEAAPENWQTIIGRERDKLKALGRLPAITVTGAGQQVAAPIAEVFRSDPQAELKRRIAEAKTPDELQQIVQGR